MRRWKRPVFVVRLVLLVKVIIMLVIIVRMKWILLLDGSLSDTIFVIWSLVGCDRGGDVSKALNFAPRTLRLGQNQATVKLLLMNFIKR